MRKVVWTLMVMVAIFSAACGSNPRNAESVTDQPVVQNDTSQTEVANAKAEATHLDLEKKYNEEAAMRVNSAFADTTSWVAAVEGTDGGPLCQLRERYNAIQFAFNTVEGKYATKVGWNQVAVTEEEARKMLKDVASQYAAEINKTLDIPYSQRRNMGSCGSGEGTFELVEAGRWTREIIDALQSFGGTPQDIATTPMRLRSRLLADYHARIKAVRNAEDIFPDTEMIVNEAQRDWNFTDEQLKLTADDIAKLKRG